MKKAIFITLIALMSCMLMVTSFAVDFETEFEHVKHVSYDEIKPGIVCGNDPEKINTPTIAAGTKEATFWGWIGSVDSDISGFSYSINGGDKKTDATFKYATEQAVVDAATGNGATYASRFQVLVPVSDGTQLVRVYADFEDGTSELFWICELTVGEPSEYVDGAGTEPTPSEPSDPGEPSDPTPTPSQKPEGPKTGDSNVIFAVAAAGIVMTILFKKKITA